MDHFARPNDELARARAERTLWRNFQGYTTKAGTDLIGMGMSAISNLNSGFFQNEKELAAYERAVATGPATVRGMILLADDKIRARVIQSLLCHAEVVKAEVEAAFGIRFDEYFSSALDRLKESEADGLVELKSDRIRPTEIGRVFLRNLAMPFDAYLPAEGERKFSRTI
jgi:oxygen-independent coproporphyrinogen-3 oxidase